MGSHGKGGARSMRMFANLGSALIGLIQHTVALTAISERIEPDLVADSLGNGCKSLSDACS